MPVVPASFVPAVSAPVPASLKTFPVLPPITALTASMGDIAVSSVKKIKLITSSRRTLRLLNILDDPNTTSMIDGYYFKGRSINNTDTLVYPNGKINPVTNLVFVADVDNSNIIGYVDSRYLSAISPIDEIYSINIPSVDLRLQDDLSDPEIHKILNGYPHRGCTITNKNRLCFPNGEETNFGLVIIQKINDRNVIGYTRKSYLDA